MTGRPAQRVKGNLKPSSSGRALLQLERMQSQQHSKPAAVAAAMGFVQNPPGGEERVELDNELLVVLRKTNKKDTTTKIKALLEFSKVLDNKDASQIKTALPLWCKCYNRLALDSDPSVRASTQECHTKVLAKVRSSVAPFLRQLMPTWFLSMFDASPSVARQVHLAMTNTFPNAKLKEAIHFCAKHIIEFIETMLVSESAETLSDPQFYSPEEREVRYVRIMASTLSALTAYIKGYHHDGDSLVPALNRILLEQNIWKIARNCTQLTECCLVMFLSCCQSVHVCLLEQLPQYLSLLNYSLQSKDQKLLQHAWDSLIVVLGWEGFWLCSDMRDRVLKKVYTGLSGESSFKLELVLPYALPLLHSMKKEAAMMLEVHVRILYAIKSVLLRRSPGIRDPEVKAFLECILYLLSAGWLTTIEGTQIVSVLELATEQSPEVVLPLLVGSLRTAAQLLSLLPGDDLPSSLVQLVCSHCRHNVNVIPAATLAAVLSVLEEWQLLGTSFSALALDWSKQLVHQYLNDPSVGAAAKVELAALTASPWRLYSTVDLLSMLLGGDSVAHKVEQGGSMSELLDLCSVWVRDEHHKQQLFLLLVQACVRSPPDVLENIVDGLLKNVMGVEDSLQLVLCVLRSVPSDPPNCIIQLLDRCLSSDFTEASFLWITKLLEVESSFDCLADRLVALASKVLISYETDVKSCDPENISCICTFLEKALAGSAAFSRAVGSQALRLAFALSTISCCQDLCSDSLISTVCSLVRVLEPAQPALLGEHLKELSRDSSVDLGYTVSHRSLHSLLVAVTAAVCSHFERAALSDYFQAVACTMADLEIWIEQAVISYRQQLIVQLCQHHAGLPVGLCRDTPVVLEVSHEKNLLSAAWSLALLDVDSCLIVEHLSSKWLVLALETQSLLEVSGKMDSIAVKKSSLNKVIASLGVEAQNCFLKDVVTRLSGRNLPTALLMLAEAQGQDWCASHYWESTKSFIECALTESSTTERIGAMELSYLLQVVPSVDFLSQVSRILHAKVLSLLSDSVDSALIHTDFIYHFQLLVSVLWQLVTLSPESWRSEDISTPCCSLVTPLKAVSSSVARLTHQGLLPDIQRDLVTYTLVEFYQLTVLSLTQDQMPVVAWDTILCNTIAFVEVLWESVAVGWLSERKYVVAVRLFSFVSSLVDIFSTDRISVPWTARYQFMPRLQDAELGQQALLAKQHIEKRLTTDWAEFFGSTFFLLAMKTMLQLSEPRMRFSYSVLLQHLGYISQFSSPVSVMNLCDVGPQKGLTDPETRRKAIVLVSQLVHLIVEGEVHTTISASHVLSRLVGLLPEHLLLETTVLTECDGDEMRSLPLILEESWTQVLDAVLLLCSEHGVSIGQPISQLPSLDRKMVFRSILLSHCCLGYINSLGTEVRMQMMASMNKGTLLKQVLQLAACLPYSHTKLMGKNFILEDPAITEGDLMYAGFNLILWMFRHTPISVRCWWKTLDRHSAYLVDKLASSLVSPMVIERELADISENYNSTDSLKVGPRPVSREVTAQYNFQDVVVEMSICLAPNHPLSPVSVKLENNVGMPSSSQNQMLMRQLVTLISHQSGSLMEGILMWKRNLDKRFHGMDSCRICFAVIHPSNQSLPKSKCRTCRNTFHSTCLYQWFSTANRSTCPLCRGDYL